ncbi:MAG TPA: hypothetical protein VEK75_06945, partial [Xanthobacteraceae bacterium]|nr:hypothetical protein [Xanthobacteraceae bacterium]
MSTRIKRESRRQSDFFSQLLDLLLETTKRKQFVGRLLIGAAARRSHFAQDHWYPAAGKVCEYREIGGSNFVLFVDDFHYIPKEVQTEIGKQIKAAAEAGVRICTASVPHRKDDVVRSNPELRGRVTGIDSEYWNESELTQIAHKGFAELNMDVSPNVIQRFAREAFGSPQLMQAICLNACFEQQVNESLPKLRRVEIDFVDVQSIFERTST